MEAKEIVAITLATSNAPVMTPIIVVETCLLIDASVGKNGPSTE